MDKVLGIKNLSKLYRNKRGIKNISLSQGHLQAAWYKGAGKTTLMKTITGLCQADQGQVKILDFDVDKHFEQVMAPVGCIIETADVYEFLSGFKNLQLAARSYPDISKTRIDEVL